MTTSAEPEKFSTQLRTWARGKQPKNLDTLIEEFEDKSFAVIMLLFMLIPALPLPTAGITHVLEAVVIILALEQVIGLKAIWLPDFLSTRIKLGWLLSDKILTPALRRIEWFERKSSPRGRYIFTIPLADRIIGLLVIAFTVASFLAPPFTGLDTLPALGVVVISLAILFDDAIMLAIGTIIGALGIVLSVGFGAVVIKFVQSLF